MTLTISMRDNPLRPCEDMTIRSTLSFSATVDDGAEGLASIDHLAHFQSDARIGDFLGDEFLKFHKVRVAEF